MLTAAANLLKTVNELIEKLRIEERDIAAERGSFDLFGLFLPEDAADRWDLLAAAEWIDKDKSEALKFLAKRIQERLTPSELTKISRIITVREDDPGLKPIQAVQVEHGLIEMKDNVFFGLPIKHAFLITSRRRTPHNSASKSAT